MLPPACLDLRLVDAAGGEHEGRAAIDKSEMRFYNSFKSADIRNALQRQNMQESDIREGNAIFSNTTS